MDIDQIRRLNIKELEKVHGPALYKRAEMTPTQFYNLRDGARDSKTGKPRGMRKQTAWKIEDAAGVPRGYLDVLHNAPAGTPMSFGWPLDLVSQDQYALLTHAEKCRVQVHMADEIEKIIAARADQPAKKVA